jgi:hypothetical protein
MAEIVLDDLQLEALARRAYERGRAQLGLTRATLVAPLAALAFLQCTTASALPVALAVTVLAGLVGVSTWRGLDYGRGASVGLAAGLAPCALPLLSTATGLFCSATICAVMPAACVAGGFVGGLVLGTRRRGPRQTASRFWMSAIGVTLAAGTVGCLGAGLMGLVGMVAGLAGGAAPVLVLRKLRPAL